MLKALLWIITFPFSLLVWPLWPKLLTSLQGWNYRRKSGPEKYGKTLIMRKPKLDTPAKAATYVLDNLCKLSFEQVAEIERGVKGVTRKDDPVRLVLYGCRISKPIQSMTSVDKISARWSRAWCGNSIGIWTLTDEKKWIKACRACWTPIYLEAVQRALQRGDKSPDQEKTLANFYPPIVPHP